MKTSMLIPAITLAIASTTLLAGGTSYVIKQNTRTTAVETEIKHLRKAVDRNSVAVDGLSVKIARMDEKLELIINLYKGAN